MNNKRNKNNALSSSSTVQSGSVAQHQQNGGPNLSNGHHTVTANGDATAGKSEYQIRYYKATYMYVICQASIMRVFKLSYVSNLNFKFIDKMDVESQSEEGSCM